MFTSPRRSVRSAALARLALVVAAGAAAGVAAPALAQAIPPFYRTGGLLVADLSTDNIILLRDLNNDGDALDVGEASVWFDASNASNLVGASGAVTAIFPSIDGSVYWTELDTDSVYRAIDRNNDGDVNDANEVVRWFNTSNNFSFFNFPTPNGLTQNDLGYTFVANAGISGIVADGVWRLLDGDDMGVIDGDANDTGEGLRVLDQNTLTGGTTSNPFDIVAIGSDIFFIDSGPNPDVIYRLRDLNNDGDFDDANERTVWASQGVNNAVVGQGLATDGSSIYAVDRTGSAQRLVRMTDANANGVIDAGESVEVWNESLVPSGFGLSNAFSLAVGRRTAAEGPVIAVTSSGGDTEDNVFLLRDLSGDGDYNDTGETTVFADFDVLGTALDTARAAAFLGKVCPGDFNLDTLVNDDDLGEFITSYFELLTGPGGFARPCPGADAPFNATGYRADFNRDCTLNDDDLGDFITAFFTECP